MIKFLIENWLGISGTVGTAIAWIGSVAYKRQQDKNSAKSTELENIKTVRLIEKELLIDMQGQVDKLIEINAYLRKVNEEQSKDLIKYKLKYGEL